MSKKSLAEELAQFVRAQRGDLTLRQFSRKVGISDSSLQRIELGQQNVSLATIQQLVTRLGCNVGEMFGEK